MARTLHRLHSASDDHPHRRSGTLPRISSDWTNGRSNIFEILVFSSFAALLYKAREGGFILLCLLAVSFFVLRGKPWRPSMLEAGLTIAYIAMATVTAFFVDVWGGLERTSQFLIVVFAAAAVVKYSSRLTADEKSFFIKRFTAVNVAILVHCVLFHLARGQTMTWKYLADTKFVFSSMTVLIFIWEDEIRARSLAAWVGVLVLELTLVLMSGERKAYLLFIALYLLSRARLTTIAGTVSASFLAATLYIALVPNSYVTRQLTSGFSADKVASLPNRYFFTVSAIGANSDLIREFVDRNADRLFHDHPWLGLGATGYGDWAMKTYGPITVSRGLSMNVHGERHRVPVEGGLLGIAIALSFLGAVAVRSARFWIRQGGASATSRSRAPAYLSAFMFFYIYSEALDTTMMMLILLVGFITASLGVPTLAETIRARPWGTLRDKGRSLGFTTARQLR